MGATSGQSPSAAHTELILQQIDGLPTLPPVAARVLALSQDEQADFKEITRVIESDPALTARLLSLCRRADRATSTRITTVDRAAVMLGVEAVRAAMLSVEVFRLMGDDGGAPETSGAKLDRRELWRHCLACACACELLAESHPERMGGFRPQEAFLAGLLHDIGKLALDRVLPRAYARVVAICDAQPVIAAEVERRVLGIDHHVAGKRLAEHWGLPHALQDVVWLHGQRAAVLPGLPHLPLIAVVTVADALVRRLHMGWSGSDALLADVEGLCREHGFDPRRVKAAHEELRSRLTQRSRDLGLDAPGDTDLLIECITAANKRLGRLMESGARRGEEAQRRQRALEAIAAFHSAQSDQRTLADAAGEVLRSVARTLGAGFGALVIRAREEAEWTLFRSAGDAEPVCEPLGEAGSGVDLAALAGAGAGARTLDDGAALAWLAERFGPMVAQRVLRLVTLAGGPGLMALLVHDRPDAGERIGEDGITALAAIWGAALISAGRHDGARRLGEQLAEANRALIDLQGRLIEAESLARLGQVAAGAAHEMNNPLTVLSGNAQLLAARAEREEDRRAARACVEAAETLTGLITALHLYADPPQLERGPVDIAGMLEESARRAERQVAESGRGPTPVPGVRIRVEGKTAAAWIDGRLIGMAVTELVVNALQSGANTPVEVRAHPDALDGRLMITVSDDGRGMSERALRHAFDPFFSELPAGRRSGLGLTRARRFVELHGGEVILESGSASGTRARIVLPQWREPGAREAA